MEPKVVRTRVYLLTHWLRQNPMLNLMTAIAGRGLSKMRRSLNTRGQDKGKHWALVFQNPEEEDIIYIGELKRDEDYIIWPKFTKYELKKCLVEGFKGIDGKSRLFRRTYDLGYINYSIDEIKEKINDHPLKGQKYNVINQNCQHFVIKFLVANEFRDVLKRIERCKDHKNDSLGLVSVCCQNYFKQFAKGMKTKIMENNIINLFKRNESIMPENVVDNLVPKLNNNKSPGRQRNIMVQTDSSLSSSCVVEDIKIIDEDKNPKVKYVDTLVKDTINLFSDAALLQNGIHTEDNTAKVSSDKYEIILYALLCNLTEDADAYIMEEDDQNLTT